jgi:hypothetical protein
MEQAANINQAFTVKSTLREGWHLVHGTKLSVLATILPMLVCSFVAFLIVNLFHLQTTNYYTALLFNLLSPLVDAIVLSGFLAGLAMIGLKRARHEAVKWSEGLGYFGKLPKLASIAYLEALSMLLLTSIMVFMSTLVVHYLPISNTKVMASITMVPLFILVFALKSLFSFSFQFALDKGLPIMASIVQTIKTVSRHYGKVFAVIIILALLNLIGACFAGIGLFWTIPLSYNSIGVMYRELVDKGV